jgi:hypothetical protein
MVGVVRDHRTGKPIAGARLATVFSALGQARTNERGEFRLAGLPKRPRYAVDVFGPDEASYLSFGKSDIPDTPGVDPVRIDFEMERGVMVRGRVVEKGTGRPVLCSVKYQSRPDNPRLKDFPTLSSQNQQHWGLASGGPDGRFSILVLPGPGVLVVSAGGGDETRPPLAMTAEELAKWKVRLLSARPVLAVADIDPDEADPKSLVCDLVVERRKAP